MTGAELKNHLEEHGYNPSKMYGLLGMTSQAYNSAMKPADIKTGFLEKICEVTGLTMAFFYPQAYNHNEVIQTFNRGHNIANGNGSSIVENDPSHLFNIIETQKATIEDLRRDKDDLRERIEELKSKLKEYELK